MQRRTLLRSMTAGPLAAALGAAAGCDKSAEGNDAGSGQSRETIPYLTSYGNFGRDAYVYVAQEKGYFAAAGFDVDIQPGQGTGANIKQILAGNALFTPVDLSGCLVAVGGKEKVAGVTAVAAIHQRTLTAIISLEGNKIGAPRDLEGKTLADLPGSVQRTLFPTYAKLANFDYTKVKWINATPQTVMGTLISGEAAGIGQFVVGKPTLEALANGRKAVVLPFSDYLGDLYGNVLITSADYARKNPEKVKRFTAALLRGLSDAIDNPTELGKILQKYVPTANPGAAAAEMNLMAPYVRSAAAGLPVGALLAERVARSIAILQGSGQVEDGLTPEQVLNADPS